MKIIIRSVFSALIFAAGTEFSLANQPSCGPRAALIKTLTQRYSETLQSSGVDASANQIEIYANVTNGSWSLVVTSNDGVSCLLASGQNFQQSKLT
ncbi:MAG: hypothetical protein AAF198_06055 [Pseudomonadota bacterium]